MLAALKFNFLFIFFLIFSACSHKNSENKFSLIDEAPAVNKIFSNNLDFEIIPKSTDQYVFAIGDIHGDVEILKKIILATELFDKNFNWISKNSYLVLTGDYVDRGSETKAVLNFLIQLKKSAQNRIQILSGNHERMRLIGWSKDAPKEDSSFEKTLFLIEPYSSFISNLPIIKK